MQYHITITDNETGKTLVDMDTCAIIGAVDEGEGTREVTMTKCNGETLLATACGAMFMAEQVIRKQPKKLQRVVKKMVRKAVRRDA